MVVIGRQVLLKLGDGGVLLVTSVAVKDLKSSTKEGSA
jgi:hypothetical protein